MTRNPRRKALATMRHDCAEFNARHPIGSPLLAWFATRDDPPTPVEVIEPGATVLNGHTAVVWVTGGRGCVALTHVSPPPA